MIILFLTQLFIGTVFILGFLGQLMNFAQRIIKPEKFYKFLFVTTILTIVLNCMIAYYYSECVYMHAAKHNGMTFTSISALLLLSFMLTGPAKYAESREQSRQILFSGTIGAIFYIIIRFSPELGTLVFGWLPVYIWT
jgi:uncharacterized membrane protein HdeD (DUF308 family)